MIEIKGVSKRYRVPVENEGTALRRKYRDIYGLKDVSLQISQGEFIGLVGLNGAGKTTLIKILSGILTPTQGEVSVMGFCPYRQRKKYTKQIGVVMAQKSSLFYDLPVMESYKFYAKVYKISRETYERNLRLLDQYMEISQFLHIPVRKLSLGQRMRCEIGVALLHNPKVLFLDEPTLGLDIISKKAILSLLKILNKEMGITMILTTHDIEDISALCERIILLSKGIVSYDGSTSTLCGRNRYKHIRIEYKEPFDFSEIDTLIEECTPEETAMTWRIKTEYLFEVVQFLSVKREKITDFNIQAVSLESTIYDYFQNEEKKDEYI